MSPLFGDIIPVLRHQTLDKKRRNPTTERRRFLRCWRCISWRRDYDLALSKPSSTSNVFSFSSAMWSISALRAGVQPCLALFSAMGGV